MEKNLKSKSKKKAKNNKENISESSKNNPYIRAKKALSRLRSRN